MAIDRYISGDSHVLEPADLWVERMDNAFRDQAPRVVHSPPGFEGDPVMTRRRPWRRFEALSETWRRIR